MMNKEVAFKNGNTVVHFANYSQQDVALCADDLAGDYEWEAAVDTDKPVTCRNCIALVRYCQTLNLNQ